MEHGMVSLSALIARVTADPDAVDLPMILGRIADWTKLSDIDYNLATPENLCKIIGQFEILCGLDANDGFREMVFAISNTAPVAIHRRVL